MRLTLRRGSEIQKQRGAAALIMLTILILGAATLLVSQLNQLSSRFDNHRQSDQSLQAAKESLLGWALSYTQRPGLMPVPDLRNDNNYDGESDCPFGAINANHLLGRLPWRAYLDAPPNAYCSSSRGGVGAQLTDSAAEPLWYAVSANLLYSNAYPSIHPDTVNLGAGWITVRDAQGNVVSNRVAAVVIAPGAMLPGQNRAVAAPTAANYLDSVTIGAANFSNADLDLDFIAGDESDTFNDRLIYITIDELMAQVERKVGATASACLDAYAAASGNKYSWAAPLNGAAPPSYTGLVNNSFGRIPSAPNIEASPGVNDGTMQSSWQPANCFSSLSYWLDWREFVFYQVAAGYAPGSTATCPVCLTFSGAGNYRAMVIVGGAALLGQARVTNADKGNIANYLEGDNADGDNDFENQPGSAVFNDRAVCLDGGTLCR